MNLQDFFDYKNQLMEDFVTNTDIVNLIDDNVPLERAESLIYKNIFPYEYLPETVDHGNTYVCCDVDVKRSISKTYLAPIIYIWVFTHKSLLRLPEGGVRTDKLCNEICKQINGSRKYGLGELYVDNVKRFAPMTDYQGKVMTFNAKEFSKQYDPNKFTPSNRKR